MFLSQPARLLPFRGRLGVGRRPVLVSGRRRLGRSDRLAGLLGIEEETVWGYIYVFLCYAGFAIFWMRYSPHKWSLWSVAGSALIVFVTWFQSSST